MAVPSSSPFGSWPSPISAESLVAGAVRVSETVLDGDDVWWAEGRPTEGGRTALVCNGTERTPDGANVRTRVHEYGGGSWWVQDRVAYYVDFGDQQLRRLDADGTVTTLTFGTDRYADGRPVDGGAWYVCVRERAGESEPVNEIVAVATNGSGIVNVLVSGPDFVSNPRVSPDGTSLAWVQWNHPNMPWDDTELWVADYAEGHATQHRQAVDPVGESFSQPEWSPDGFLYVVSDRSNWWGLYRLQDDDLAPVFVGEFEVATPHWVFGLSRYAFIDDDSVVIASGDVERDRLDVLNLDNGELTDFDVEATTILSVRCNSDGKIAYVGSSWSSEPAVEVIASATVSPRRDLGLAETYLRAPEFLTFPTSGGEQAFAWFYAPEHESAFADGTDRPPLVVLAHGGPTGAARRQLDLGVRFWTSRGIGVVDVDYRGSTGYGRVYRQSLHGRWGVADADDCVAAAKYLVDRGDADPHRLIIRGGSAGGYTVLRALQFSDTFSAGGSRYGVADLEALAQDTHKFEARYLDRLIAPYPECREVYIELSPIHHVDKLNTPMIVLQGDEDEIVPPNQSEMIVDALHAKSVPVSYLLFEGEQHGFRKAENVIKALEAELAFYGEVLGFEPADELAPVEYR